MVPHKDDKDQDSSTVKKELQDDSSSSSKEDIMKSMVKNYFDGKPFNKVDDPVPQIVMTMQHCCACNAIYELIWMMCFKRTIDVHPCYEIKIKHKEQTFTNVFFEVQLYQDIYSSKSISLIVKRLNGHGLSLVYRNERMFYEMIVPHLEDQAAIIPRCYTLKNSPEYQADFIVMEDLTNKGYTIIERRLDEKHLLFCVRSLARFHRHMFRLQEKKHQLFRKFINNIKDSNLDQERMRQLKKLRFFRNDGIVWEELKTDPSLKMKLLEKLNKMEGDLLTNEPAMFSTVIHGRFVRSKLMFKHDVSKKPCEMKVLGWHAVTFGAVATDFSRILLSNLPDIQNPISLIMFFDEILTAYTEQVEKDPVACRILRKEICQRFMYSYIDFYWTMNNHVTLLNVFNALGGLD